MARHQQEVGLRAGQSVLQPDQLTVCVDRTQGASRLLVQEVIGVSTQHYGVEHDDAQSLPSVGNTEVELVVIGREFPKDTK